MQDFKQFVGRRVLVFTDVMTFDGTLVRTSRDGLVLEHAQAVSDSGGRQPVDGHAIVPALQVQWMQVP